LLRAIQSNASNMNLLLSITVGLLRLVVACGASGVISPLQHPVDVKQPLKMPTTIQNLEPLDTRLNGDTNVAEGLLCGNLRNKHTLLFLHFQKCGGTSIERALRVFATKCKLGFVRSPKGYRSELRRGRLNFLVGHIHYGVHKSLPKRAKYDYVALLREPIDRAWSQYKHNGERRCRCSFKTFAHTRGSVQYYMNRLADGTRRLNTSLHNMKQVTLLADVENINKWYAQLEILLQKYSPTPLRLPPLIASNVRNESKFASLVSSKSPRVGSTYSRSSYEAFRASKDYEILKAANENDYVLLGKARTLPSYIS